jgi:PqqD family protein of HPr-rel-A system
MEASPDTTIEPDPDVVSRRLGDEVVLVHLGSNRIFRLNRTAARLWELIGEGVTTATALFEALSSEFDVGEGELRGEIDGTLERLKRQGLVRNGAQTG